MSTSLLPSQHPYADPFETTQLKNSVASHWGWTDRLARAMYSIGILRLVFGPFSAINPVVKGPKAFVVHNDEDRSAGRTSSWSRPEIPSAAESDVAESRVEYPEVGGVMVSTKVPGDSNLAEFQEPPEESSGSRKSAGDLWGVARAAVWSGRVKRLPASHKYDQVSATFHALFPLEFDRVLPIFNCGAVESLLLQWNRTMASLEYVRWIEPWKDGLMSIRFSPVNT